MRCSASARRFIFFTRVKKTEPKESTPKNSVLRITALLKKSGAAQLARSPIGVTCFEQCSLLPVFSPLLVRYFEGRQNPFGKFIQNFKLHPVVWHPIFRFVAAEQAAIIKKK